MLIYFLKHGKIKIFLENKKMVPLRNIHIYIKETKRKLIKATKIKHKTKHKTIQQTKQFLNCLIISGNIKLQ